MSRVQRSIALLAGAVLACVIGACAARNEMVADESHATAPTAIAGVESMEQFPLSTCFMCERLLGARGEALDFANQGRPLRVCSRACLSEFERDLVAGLARADAALIADQRPHYPTGASIVDGRPLGDSPEDFVWGNRMFRARDRADRSRILADPARAIASLDRAVIAAQRPTYAMLDKCPVQGDILPNESRIDIVVANRMIRVCCARCVRVVRARPYQYLAMVDFANREERERREREGEAP